MAESKELAVREQGELTPFMMSTEQLLARKKSIQDLQSKVMVKDVDFGIIPGCNKPSLLKPGAETLNVTFGLRPILNPAFDVISNDLPGGHREFQVTVHILSAGSDKEIATGLGSCSTSETKYRFRKAEQKCPKCGKPSVIKGKKEYGGGWVCFTKKDGCGAKFKDGDPAIENQEMGRIEHDNPADYFNTCLKMAKKRALVDGTLNATGASHVFTQDVEDMEKEIIRDAEYTPAPITEPTEKKAEETTGKVEPPAGTEESQGGQAERQDDPDKVKQEQIFNWCLEMAGGKPDEAEKKVIAYTSFTITDKKTKEKKDVPGVANPYDLHGKRLDVTLDRVQKSFYAWKNTGAENEGK